MSRQFGKGDTSEGSGTAAVIRSLRDADTAVVCTAAAQAGEQRDQAAVPALIELLYKAGPSSKPLIAAAARALGDIGDVRAIHHLGEAGYAYGCGKGISGLATSVETLEAKGDNLLEKAINEAEHKLLNQPGAEQYLAQLRRIRMYTFGDFVRSGEILIHPEIQNQPQYPFTIQAAMRFFKNFRNERFAFEGEIRSILVYDGKEALPRHSYAEGHLFAWTLDELEEGGQHLPDPVGKIHFELGGNTATPYIDVSPEPSWPRPSIVKRSVNGDKEGFRFEELI